MRKLLVLGVLVAVPGLCAAAEPPLPDYGPSVAEPATADIARQAPREPRRHATPRIKLSYRRFAINGIDGNPITLDGGQLDAYPVSMRWFRLGMEAEGGHGSTSDAVANVAGNLWYGLVGLSLGVQYPARVTPFAELRGAVGVLGGSLTGSAIVAGAPVATQGFTTATLLYLAGVDAGIELYAVGRTYVSVSLGWAHPTYLGVSLSDLQATGTVHSRRISADTFTFKVGLGF